MRLRTISDPDNAAALVSFLFSVDRYCTIFLRNNPVDWAFAVFEIHAVFITGR